MAESKSLFADFPALTFQIAAGTLADAFRFIMGPDIEVLVTGNAYLLEADQDPAFKLDLKDAYALG